MPRKQRRTASSSTAASQSSLPTFTSFAAATAQALPTGEATVTPATPWDHDALSLLKRLSKRDTNTKLRTISDLVAHIEALDGDGAGPAFVEAWGPTFRTVMMDDAASVRTGALNLMALVVNTFRNNVQPIFAVVLPSWLAALWDFNPSVADVAKSTLNNVLSTQNHRKKVLARYKPNLLRYCQQFLRDVSDRRFLQSASATLSILLWIVQVSEDTDDVSEILDDPSFPLKRLANGPRKSDQNAAALVSRFAISILPYLNNEQAEHQQRAQRFAAISLIAIRLQQPLGWDLVISLYHANWPDTFATPEFEKLPRIVGDALAVSTPAAAHALLPLVDALPGRPESADFAVVVLNRLGRGLGTADVEANTIPASYVFSTLSAYVETFSFVYTTAVQRWLKDADECNRYKDTLFNNHIIPTTNLYLSGKLPRISKNEATNHNNASPLNKLIRQTSDALANLLRRTEEAHVLDLIRKLTPQLWENLLEGNTAAKLHRYEAWLLSLDSLSYQYCFYKQLINSAHTETPIQTTITTLAQIVRLQGSSFASEEGKYVNSSSELGNVEQLVDCALSELVKAAPFPTSDSSVLADLAAVCAWLYWSTAVSTQYEKADELIFEKLSKVCNQEQLFVGTAAIVAALEERREYSHATPWIPLQGARFEQSFSAAIVSTEQSERKAARRLIATALRPGAGAELSTDTAAQVISATSGWLDGDIDSEVDAVVGSLLTSAPGQAKDNDVLAELACRSILRAVSSEHVLQALVEYLRKQTVRVAVERINEMMDILGTSSSVITDEASTPTCASALSSIITVLGETDVKSSVALCKRLFKTASASLGLRILRTTNLRFIFGDGPENMVDVNHLVSVMQAMYPQNSVILSSVLKDYLRAVGEEERGRVAAEIADLALHKSADVQWWILKLIIHIWLETEGGNSIVDLVVERLLRYFPGKTEASVDLLAAAQLVYICILESKGAFVAGLKSILTECVQLIRRDPVSSKGNAAVDILTACLRAIMQCNGDSVEVSPWLLDSISLVLRAIRRTFEQPGGRKKEQLEDLEMRGCLLVSCVASALGGTAISGDDRRFWFLRCKDSLSKYAKKMSSVNSKEELQWKRVGALCCLAEYLSDSAESPDEDVQFKHEDVDEVCHSGAWSTVVALPKLESTRLCAWEIGERAEDCLEHKCFKLVMRAAERDVLLGRDNGFPISREYVYRTIPFLVSKSTTTRKTVLTIIAHAAAVDLPDTAKSIFPENGFADENQESEAVHKVMPTQLQAAIEYPLRNEDVRRDRDDVERLEIGYFLAWRLFLDLVRADDDRKKGSDVDPSDEFSFRRVGVRYLRDHPDTFDEFMKRCIDVVVDGSSKEQIAAALGAAEALEAEERAAQGLQLAQQQEAKKQSAQELAATVAQVGEDLEKEVGRAAGIAFSRALQRLPALSRHHVSDSLDQGRRTRVGLFVRKRISPLLIAAEIRKVKEWGSFGGGNQPADPDSDVGTLKASGSAAGREVWATYEFKDVTLEIAMQLPDIFPLRSVEVEPRSRFGMSESRWRKTMLAMTTLLQLRDGTLAEAVDLWRRNLDKSFQGAEECPICYSVLHIANASLPKKQCRTCKTLFHPDCLFTWFRKSNSNACPLCRSAF